MVGPLIEVPVLVALVYVSLALRRRFRHHDTTRWRTGFVRYEPDGHSMTVRLVAEPGLARVGRAVAERRLELGFASQRELAEKAGVALSTAAHLERGHTFPRRSNARKLEAALDWPPGTLVAIRRGEPLPSPASHLFARSPAVSPSATSTAQALGIASAVAGVAATCMNIVVRHTGADPAAAQALRELDAQLLELETLIAASLPHAESFDDTMSALAEVHRHREALRQAAGQGG